MNQTTHTVKINRDGPSPEARKKLVLLLAKAIPQIEQKKKDQSA